MGTHLPLPQRGTATKFLAHVYCGQMVAHLSYCWALVIVFGVLSPEKILHWKVRYLSSWPIKCSHSNLKKKLKSHFSVISHLEHSQLQLDEFSEHEIAFIFYYWWLWWEIVFLLRTHNMVLYVCQWQPNRATSLAVPAIFSVCILIYQLKGTIWPNLC